MAENKAEEPKAKGSKNMLLLVALGTVLTAGAGTAGYLVGNHTAPPAQAQALSGMTPPPGEGAGGSGKAVGPMVDIESFVINILEDKDTRYLKAAITLELENTEAAEEAKQRMPQVRDAILLMVGNKTFNEVRDLQGKLQLRAELMAKINEILKKGQVRRIYFTDFVVQ